MKKIRENICPKNATCSDAKTCNAAHIEQIGYGAPIETIKDGKCAFCGKCNASELKYCSISGEE